MGRGNRGGVKEREKKEKREREAAGVAPKAAEPTSAAALQQRPRHAPTEPTCAHLCALGGSFGAAARLQICEW